MQHSFLRVFDQPSDAVKAVCQSWGYVCSLMGSSPAHAKLPVRYLRAVIGPAVQQKRIKIYFNDDGQAVGFVVWAFFSPDVERRYIESGPDALHLSEWNEGTRGWICDFLVPFGHIRHVLRDLRDTVFAAQLQIAYHRVKGRKVVFRRLCRDRAVSFFRHDALPPCFGPPAIAGFPPLPSILISLR